ncbi:PREDICTED: uncharacterized protein LOC104545987 [Mesitornis unicolor]|uniref:uncharacterized protein LOC104545987 n=1 Tax=Mesitornis unicolor TaxID=54374 RepID=UPI000528C88B|nr:PREDICTED: uncharacterized protein LOC104545987 [Mesitornis unicolor]
MISVRSNSWSSPISTAYQSQIVAEESLCEEGEQLHHLLHPFQGDVVLGLPLLLLLLGEPWCEEPRCEVPSPGEPLSPVGGLPPQQYGVLLHPEHVQPASREYRFLLLPHQKPMMNMAMMMHTQTRAMRGMKATTARAKGTQNTMIMDTGRHRKPMKLTAKMTGTEPGPP